MVENTYEKQLLVKNLEKRKYIINCDEYTYNIGDLLIINYPIDQRIKCDTGTADYIITPILVAKANVSSQIPYGKFPV